MYKMQSNLARSQQGNAPACRPSYLVGERVTLRAHQMRGVRYLYMAQDINSKTTFAWVRAVCPHTTRIAPPNQRRGNKQLSAASDESTVIWPERKCSFKSLRMQAVTPRKPLALPPQF